LVANRPYDGGAGERELVASSRRRSESSQLNDERILDAALAELAASGIDRLAMRAVARRAGLTTGALYPRYESAGELGAAVWTHRVSEHHAQLLRETVAVLVDGEPFAGLDRVLAQLRDPAPETIVALEMLGASRRVDELEEVVAPDVERWMAAWGAGPRTRRRRRRAQVIYALATVWGVLLHTTPGHRRLDWRPLFARIRWSYAQPYAEPAKRLVVPELEAVHAQTGDPVHDALLDAVAAIVARVGLERATGSRIARRAGLTHGAIYARYETKEALLEHAIAVLQSRRFTDDMQALDAVLAARDPGVATAQLVGGYLGSSRRDWRRFRVEAHLAARAHPGAAATLDRVQEEARDAYLDAIGARTPRERRELDLLARSAQVMPIGLAFADLLVPDVPAIDWRLVLCPMMSPRPTE
jgi:AcrR family transcriptional regulator